MSKESETGFLRFTSSSDMWNVSLAKANFTVCYPRNLPNGLVVADEIIYRPENHERNYPRCSLKLYVGNKLRRLSIKQFNYDWSPPAYDCPALWRNRTEFPNIDTSEPIPHLLGNSILWIGFNYRNKRAASVTRDRTLIEFTILEGDFTNQELIQITTGLMPLNTNHAGEILSKTFAELSYGYPKIVRAVKVPISFWKIPVGDSGIKFQRAYSVHEVPSEIKKHLEILQINGYFLDSVFTYQRQEEFSAKEDRVEYVYEHSKIPGVTVRLVRSPVESNTLVFPPVPDTTQKFKYEELSGLKRRIYYAYRSKDYGPHEVVWQDRNYTYLLLVKPTSWTNREWFLGFLEEILGND